MNTMIKPLAAHQTGSTLVLSLLILLIMTVAGVAAMRGGLMQERMAGNVNLQTLAFEAASAGINEALDFGMDYLSRIQLCPDETGATPHWEGTETRQRNINLAAGSPQQGLVVRYELSIDCLEFPGEVDLDTGDQADPDYLIYVTSTGEVLQGNELLAARQIEIRIRTLQEDGILSAMHIAGDPQVTFAAGNSNSFVMDGNGSTAISASNRANRNIIANDIAGRNRLQNFRGGIGISDYPAPFNDAAELARFVLRIKAYMQHWGIGATPNTAGYCGNYPGTTTPVPLRFVQGDWTVGQNEQPLSGITYVTGNLNMQGNPQGDGLLIVEGTVRWRGTAQFQGILIALGGSFELYGGGRGETKGTMFITNLNLRAIADASDSTDPEQFGKYLTRGYRTTFPVNLNDVQVLELSDVAGLSNDPYRGNVLRFIDNVPPGVNFNHWFDIDSGNRLPGIASRLEIISGDMEISGSPEQYYRGLAYYGLYAGCDANSWLTGAGGNLARSTTCATNDGFGASRVDFSGGGTHKITYECERVDTLMTVLNQCRLPDPTNLTTECDTSDSGGPCFCDPDDPLLRKNCYRLDHPWGSDLPEPFDCNPDPSIRKDEGAVSWRENIGWREQLGN